MSDGRDAQALVTGGLFGLISKYVSDPDRGILIDDVEPDRDTEGNYKPSLTLKMRSGAVLKVLVIDDTPLPNRKKP